MVLPIVRRVGVVALSFIIVSAASMLPGCERGKNSGRAAAEKRPDEKEILAKVDDTVITIGDFQDRINKQAPFVRARYTSIERKKEFLDNLVRLEVLAAEAERRGLDKDPDVQRTIKQALVQKLMRDEFESRVKLEDISDNDAKAYYDAHPDEFNKPEEVRAALILVRDERTARQVLADPRIKGLETAEFRKLVEQYSIDAATRERGGDLRYFDRNTKELPPEVVTAVFGLANTGDVTSPIKTQQGWNILKLTGRRRAVSRTFDEVKLQIKNRLFRDKRQSVMDSYIKDLRNKAKVEVHEDRLSKVVIEPAGNAPGPGPGLAPPPPGAFHPPGQNAPQASPQLPGQPPQPHGAPAPAAPSQ